MQQYQRYLSDADRILIALHNDPDPDAIASGPALRNILRRTKTTAILGTLQVRDAAREPAMLNLLDVHVELMTRKPSANSIASVWSTCSRTTSAASSTGSIWSSTIIRAVGLHGRVQDVRPDYGSTCTILTEHLRQWT